MHPRVPPSVFTALLTVTLFLSAACDKLRMPQLTNPPPPQQTIPASVTLLFDDSVRTATLEMTVCADTQWKGQLGEAIIQAFQKTGQARFAQVTVGGADRIPRPVSAPHQSAITATIKLAHKSFTTRTRSGSDDTFLTQLDLQLSTVFEDAQGKPLAEVPLVYSEQVKIWTPQFGGSGLCATQQLDGAIKQAAERLADQLVAYVAQLTAKPQGQAVAAMQDPGSRLPSGEASTLILRATLLDQNNDLLLEAGEKVGIRIDVTNGGTTPSGPANVTLSGTPWLTSAFTEALAAPVTIAALQPGETTSTMIWGMLPGTIDGPRGELTITVSQSGTAGGAPATQTLVASVAQRGGSAATAPAPAGRAHDPDRYAVIVGLSRYRTPWPGWKDGLSTDTKAIASLFTDTLDVPEEHTLLLQDELAARNDIEEALTTWLPKRITKTSIVFVYFAGQTLVEPKNGEVFLIPYDATPASSPFRLISLRFLQNRLQKLGARLAVAIIDGPVTSKGGSKHEKAKAVPNWLADLDGSLGPRVGALVQVSRLHGAAGQHPSLLAGLSGQADLDHDGTVTVGEWLRSLRGTAVTAPALPPTLAVQAIPLAQVNRR